MFGLDVPAVGLGRIQSTAETTEGAEVQQSLHNCLYIPALASRSRRTFKRMLSVKVLLKEGHMVKSGGQYRIHVSLIATGEWQMIIVSFDDAALLPTVMLQLTSIPAAGSP